MSATHIYANLGQGLLGMALASAAGVTVATPAAGPIAQVFNETGALMAIMGALGGVVGMLAIQAPGWSWKLLLRRALYGAGLAFGLRVLAPPIISSVLQIEIGPDAQATEGLAASAFLLGVLQERVSDFINRKGG